MSPAASYYVLCNKLEVRKIEDMSNFGNIMKEKCMNFAIRVVNLCQFLNKEKHEYRIADQLFRSGTSIGANYYEAQCAISRKRLHCKSVYLTERM